MDTALSAARIRSISPIQTTMRAARLHKYGEALHCEEAPMPRIRAGDILLKVHFAGITHADAKVQRGDLKNEWIYNLPFILGREAVGTVEAVDNLVGCFHVGDVVYTKSDRMRDGSFAEYMAVRSDEVAHAPLNLPLAQVAGIPLAALTVWNAIVEQSSLRKGQSILIHGASGSVGTIAVQFAKIIGAHVIGTASEHNFELLRSLGVDELIDYRTQDFSKLVKAVDVVLEAAPTDTRLKSFGVMRKGGVLVSITRYKSRDNVKEKKVAAEAAEFGVTEKLIGNIHPNGAALEEITRLFDAGKLSASPVTEFPLSDAETALKMSENGKNGKIVLRVA